VTPQAQPARLSTTGQGNAGAPPAPDQNPVAFSTYYSYAGNPVTEGTGLAVYSQPNQPDKAVLGGLTRPSATAAEGGCGVPESPDGQTIGDDSLSGSGRMVVHASVATANGTYHAGEMGPADHPRGFLDWYDGTTHHLIDVNSLGNSDVDTVASAIGADPAGHILVRGGPLRGGVQTAFVRGFSPDLRTRLVDCTFVGLHVTGHVTVATSVVTNFHIVGDFTLGGSGAHVDVCGNITTFDQIVITEGFVFCVDVLHCVVVSDRRVAGGFPGGVRAAVQPDGQRFVYAATTVPGPGGHTALLLEETHADGTDLNPPVRATWTGLGGGAITSVRGA